MRSSVLPLAALACATLTTVAASADAPRINDGKFGGGNSIKMDVLAPGPDMTRMSGVVMQRNDSVVLEIVQGGKTTAKPVEIAEGTCDKLGRTQYRLPPFTGGEYTTTVKNAKLDQLQDGNHALVVFGPKRSKFACGDLVKPNIFRH